MIIDRDHDLPRYSTVCSFCRHLTGFRRCEAFDGEIPLAIWVGQNQHERPYPGDRGVKFEPVPGAKVTTPHGPDWPVIRGLRARGRLPVEEPVTA